MADEVTIKFGGSTEEVESSIDTVKGKLESLGNPVKGLIEQFGDLGGTMLEAFGLKEVVEHIAEFSEKMAEMGASVAHASQQLGLSADAVSGMRFAFGAMGEGSEQATFALERLERNMASAASETGPAQAAFEALGIKVQDGSDKLKSLDAILPEIAQKFQESADGPEKTAIAIALLGRSGAALIPFLNQGEEGLSRFKSVAEEAGTVINGPMAEGMEHSAIANYTLNQAVQGLEISLYEAFKPAIDATVNGLIEFVENINNSIRQGGALLDTLKVIVAAFNGVVAAVATASMVLQQFWQIMMIVGDSVDDAIHGRWDKIGSDFQVRLDKMKDAALEWGITVEQMLGNIGSDLGAEDHGEGEKKKTLPAIGTGSGSTGPSQVEIWRNELQQQLIAEQNYFGDSKKEELSFWQAKVALTEAGSKERLQVESQIYMLSKALAQQDLQAQLGTIKEKQEAAHNDYRTVIELEEQKLAILKQDYGQDSRQYQDALREKEKMEREHQAEITRMNLETDETLRKMRLNDIAAQKSDLDVAVQLGEISNSEKIAQLKALADQEYEIQKASLAGQAEMPGQSPEAVQKLYDQIDVLTAKHTADMAAYNRQGALAAQQSWLGIVQPIESAFNTMISGIIQGTNTLHAAMAKVAQSLILSFAQARLKIELDWLAGQAAMALGAQEWANRSVLSWIFGETRKTAATVTGEATRTAASGAGSAARTAAGATEQSSFLGRVGEQIAEWLGLETSKTTETTTGEATRTGEEATASLASIAASKAEAAGEIPSYAAIAAAGAMASVAAIPFIGWAMAPEVGMETFTEAMSYLVTASAAGGWDEVPAGGAVTQLHAKEMVLSEQYASPLRTFLDSFPSFGLPSGLAGAAANLNLAPSSAAAAGSGGNTANTINVYTNDAASFANQLQRSTSPLSQALRKAGLNGQIAVRR